MLTPTARWRRERSEREIIKEQSGAEAVKIASFLPAFQRTRHRAMALF